MSLGHAAFFGSAPTRPACWRSTVIGDPLLGLLAAAVAAAVLGFVTSFLVLRGADLTRLMVTLGVALDPRRNRQPGVLADRRRGWPAGHHVAPILGLFEFDIFGTHRLRLQPRACCSCCSSLARRIVDSPFGLSLRAIRDNPLRARAVGIPVNRRLVAIYTIVAAYAGIAGALLAQTTQFVSLDVLAFHRSADVLLVLVSAASAISTAGSSARSCSRSCRTCSPA